jgi:hypothetical protein
MIWEDASGLLDLRPFLELRNDKIEYLVPQTVHAIEHTAFVLFRSGDSHLPRVSSRFLRLFGCKSGGSGVNLHRSEVNRTLRAL